MEHHRPPERLRRQPRGAAVHEGRAAELLGLRRRAGRAGGPPNARATLAAYRDATIFKVIYGWGLRRTETSKLDLVDWGSNPAAAEFGRFGMLHVRYGKAKRGQPPRRRNVASVMGWAVEAVADYVENVRPRFGFDEHPALWLTERGGRVKPAEINARFVAYRDALGLPTALVPHSLRHSYVSHLTEEGVDRRFLQVQVGHECDTSTADLHQPSGIASDASKTPGRLLSKGSEWAGLPGPARALSGYPPPLIPSDA